MESTIFNQTMTRVHRIHRIKAFVASPLPKIIGAVILFALVSSFVSYSHVFQNMPSLLHLKQFFNFVGVAFANTEFSVQIVSIVSTALVLFAIRDFLSHLHPRHFRVG